jgi:hypothetical protein
MGRFHPTLPDGKALTLVRAALKVRTTCIEVVAEMKGQANAPRYGRPLTSPPPLKSRPCNGAGLSLVLEGLPLSIASEWGTLEIAPSCTEATPKQTKEVLRRLAQRGVVLDLDGDPDEEFLIAGYIKSVGGVRLPAVDPGGPGAFRYFMDAKRAYQAACDAASGR